MFNIVVKRLEYYAFFSPDACNDFDRKEDICNKTESIFYNRDQ